MLLFFYILVQKQYDTYNSTLYVINYYYPYGYLLLLPVVMGISYELLKWCGRSDNLATRIIRQPGIWVQHLTVFEPDDSMIEVAIAAVTPVLPEDPEDGRW